MNEAEYRIQNSVVIKDLASKEQLVVSIVELSEEIIFTY
jgi:hypothetical protein